jgi:hypothetical protein
VRALVARHPGILGHRAETLAANIADTAWRLGVSRRAVLATAVKNPVWFYLGADAISLHALRAAVALKVRKAEFVAALLRAPTLVCRDPKGLARRAAIVRAIAKSTGERLTTRGLLARFPTALTYGEERLRARLAIARRNPKRWSWMSLVCLPSHRLSRRPGLSGAAA